MSAGAWTGGISVLVLIVLTVAGFRAVPTPGPRHARRKRVPR